MTEKNQHVAVFQNVWQVASFPLAEEVTKVWKNYFFLDEKEIAKRLGQLVFVVHNDEGQVMGVSTAYKAYIKQLKNYLYGVRFMIVPEYRVPGLLSHLANKTRDFLEDIHVKDESEQCIGLITLIENEGMKKYLKAPVWPSGFVYLGNSAAGHHIRVYYFKGARITKP